MADNPNEEIFTEDEVEILKGPSLDDKLDLIIELLRRNEQEHAEIKERLEKIDANQDCLQASYQQHGLALGQLTLCVEALNGRR
jgi:hypothetical protein